MRGARRYGEVVALAASAVLAGNLNLNFILFIYLFLFIFIFAHALRYTLFLCLSDFLTWHTDFLSCLTSTHAH